jgi:hypothetical protein
MGFEKMVEVSGDTSNRFLYFAAMGAIFKVGCLASAVTPCSSINKE